MVSLKKKWWIVISVVLVVVLAVFFVAGYFLGNVPLASKLLGTNKPRDLGVNITVDSAYQGIKDLKKPLTPQDVQAIIQNPKAYQTIKATITQEEASSLLAIGDIPDFPFRATQIKFEANGKVEASGVLDIKQLQLALKDVGAASDIVDRVMSFVKNGNYMNFYMEGTCSVVNNRVSANLDQVQIGRINLPDDLVKSNSSVISDGIARTLTANGYNIRSMTISEGKVALDMDRPAASVSPWLKMVQY
jgi:hypothetical protein